MVGERQKILSVVNRASLEAHDEVHSMFNEYPDWCNLAVGGENRPSYLCQNPSAELEFLSPKKSGESACHS